MSEKVTKLSVFKEKFPAIANADTLKEVISENLEGIEVSGFSLPKIKIPSGGGTSFEDPIDSKTFEAIILVHQNVRAYWPENFEGESTPPDCSSFDGVIGTGQPGGSCASCPFAKFGSDSNARGQACKKVIKLFLLRENRGLPEVLNLPPTSLKAYSQYVLELASLGIMKYGLKTIFSLEKTKSSTGMTYSKIKMEVGEVLPQEMLKDIKIYSSSVKENFITNHALPVIEADEFLDEDEK